MPNRLRALTNELLIEELLTNGLLIAGNELCLLGEQPAGTEV